MRLLSAAVWLCLWVSAAFAQSERGAITGTVSDPAGAIFAGATVEAKNVATGAVYPAATTGTGNYTIAGAPPGTYEVSVDRTRRTKPRFRATRRFQAMCTVGGVKIC